MKTSFEPSPIAPLTRYCTAYRLGLIGNVLTNGLGKGSAKTANMCGYPTSYCWTREERRWCAFLRWALTKSFIRRDEEMTEDNTCVPSYDATSAVNGGGVVDHILSFLTVDQKIAMAMRSRVGEKRARSPSTSHVRDGVGEADGVPAKDAQLKAAKRQPALSKALPNADDDTLVPYFFVDPPYTDAVSVFVRIYSSSALLTDEELNHLFGRYGMMHARRVGVRRARLLPSASTSASLGGVAIESKPDNSAPTASSQENEPAAADLSNNNNISTNSNNESRGAYGGMHMHDTDGDAEIASRSEVFTESDRLQSFIVTLDDNRNCLRAIQEIRQPEIVFIAFSKPERNVYCVADLPCDGASHLRTLLSTAIPFPVGTAAYAHVVASLRLAQGGSLMEGSDGAGEGSRGGDGTNESGAPTRSSADAALALAHSQFVPDLIADHLPYWTTREQLKERFSAHGTIRKLKLSVDDRNGSFLGTALVSMGSLQECLAASDALHGVAIEEGWPMTVGVLTEQLDIVSLKTGEVLSACEDLTSPLHIAQNVVEQRRVWV